MCLRFIMVRISSRRDDSFSELSRIYSPRRHLWPTLTLKEPRSPYMWSWIQNTLAVRDYDYLQTSGLDAVMTSKMHACFFKIFGCQLLYSLGVLCPLHFGGGGISEFNGPDCLSSLDVQNQTKHCFSNSVYTKMTMANISQNSPDIWFDVLGAYLLTILTLYFLTQTWNDYTKLRHSWLGRPTTSNQSVLVDNIPLHLRSNFGLYSFFDTLFPNEVAGVAIVLDVKGLDSLIGLRDRTAGELDLALALYAKSRYKVRLVFLSLFSPHCR